MDSIIEECTNNHISLLKVILIILGKDVDLTKNYKIIELNDIFNNISSKDLIQSISNDKKSNVNDVNDEEEDEEDDDRNIDKKKDVVNKIMNNDEEEDEEIDDSNTDKKDHDVDSKIINNDDEDEEIDDINIDKKDHDVSKIMNNDEEEDEEIDEDDEEESIKNRSSNA